MYKYRIYILLIFLSVFFSNTNNYSQSNLTTVGFQVKPILPINYFGIETVSVSDSFASIDISSKLGYCFGMLIRQGISKSFSFETGINYTRRNYNLEGSSPYQNSSDKGDFGFVSYEIPLQILVYIRLSEAIFMNASAGTGINCYASNVASKGENKFIDHFSKRRWINMSILSNLGFEYRTRDKGYYYLGVSLNKPISKITRTELRYYYENNSSTTFEPIFLDGTYFTLDLRYFLPISKKDGELRR